MSQRGHPVRRGGKPNRGGGAKNRSRGGRGRGSHSAPSRGGARGGGGSFSRKQDLYDYDDLPVTSCDQYDDDYNSGYASSSSFRPYRGRGRAPKTRVQMQRLHMTSENQEMVRDMLTDLHGGEPIENTSGDEFEELDWRAESQYWMTDSKLNIEEAEANTYQSEVDAEHAQYEHFNQLALKKLQRYGFDKSRCAQSLTLNDGDIGQSLEYLLSQCFDLAWKPPPKHVQDPDMIYEQGLDASTDSYSVENEDGDCNINWEEIIEERTQAKLVLESIYEEKFTERVYNKVWIIQMDLPELTDVSRKNISKDYGFVSKDVRTKDTNRTFCPFYLKGSCKFGNRCKYLHQVNYDQVGNDSTKNVNDNEEIYQLEIRFPPCNKFPVGECPFIAFHSTNSLLSQHVCLSITDYLMGEAKLQASSGNVCLYTLANELENLDKEHLLKLYTKPPLKYSLPEPIIKRTKQQVVDTESIRKSSGANNSSKTGIVVVGNSRNVPEKSQPLAEMDKSVGQISTVNTIDEELPDKHEQLRIRYARKDTVPKHNVLRDVEKTNMQLKTQFIRLKEQENYKKMLAQRKKLPSWHEADNIISKVNSNKVVVISGETGCGKTTQVPQFILDKFLGIKGSQLCNIICTQPRRISAISVAERVSQERVDKLGATVGYQIRLESVMSAKTRLLFCTTGILLRRLEGDGNLQGITHVIVDEVHERSEDSDFLMMILRDVLHIRRDLRVILMSATLNADLFSQYFDNCPVIHIPGKTFPVDQYFLEDAVELTQYVIEEKSTYARPLKTQNAVRYDNKKHAHRASLEEIEDALSDMYISENTQPPRDNIQDQNLSVKQLFLRYTDHQKSTVKALAIMDHEKINLDLIESVIEFIVSGQHHYPRDGAILVFLPGYAEIQSMFEQLQTSHVTGGKHRHKFKIIPLHSTLSSEDQRSVFLRPREGITKIVLATNIAETSITIDDIVYVIDAGRMKEKRYDSSKGMESLDTVWVSKANALQRKGRAGRVASGVCFHLFTGHRFDWHLRDQPIPEIMRIPLEQTLLKIKILPLFKDRGVEEVMSCLVEAPTIENIQSAIKRLQNLGALDESKQLTPLGYHLAALPVDVRIGKLMLFGAIFRCLDPALTIAAGLSFKSPFVAPFGKKEDATAKKNEFAVGNSDHLTMLKAYKGWTEAEKLGSYSGYTYCQENFLSIKSLQMIASMKRQYTQLLSDIGFIKQNITSRDIERAARDGGDGVLMKSGPEANSNSENYKLVAAILVAALYPNVVQVFSPESKFQLSSAGAVPVAPKATELKFKTKIDGYVNIHPSSVNFQVRYYSSPYLVFHEKVKTSKLFIRDCSMVSVYPLLLFGGGITVDLDRGNIVISVDDGWIRFVATSHEVAELVRELRLELDQLLKDKIEQPDMDLCTCPRGSRIINTIVKLITTQ